MINSKWQNLLNIWKKVAFQKYYIYLLYNLSNSLYMFKNIVSYNTFKNESDVTSSNLILFDILI